MIMLHEFDANPEHTFFYPSSLFPQFSLKCVLRPSVVMTEHFTFVIHNHIKLNKTKSKEMIVLCSANGVLPAPLPSITRVKALNTLGVTLRRQPTMSTRFLNPVPDLSTLFVCSGSKGFQDPALHIVTTVPTMARLTYAVCIEMIRK